MRIKCALLAFLCTTIGACKTAPNASPVASFQAPSAPQLSLNDVSVMVPFKDQPDLLNKALWPWDQPNPSKFAPGMPAAPLDGEAFLPKWALEALDRQFLRDDQLAAKEHFKYEAKTIDSVREQDFFSLQQDFAALNLRFDPCANGLEAQGDDSKCVQQLRIVWQPVNDNFKISSGLHVLDHNVLTVYQLTHDEFAAVVSTLVTMQQSSGLNYALEPLGPHPVLKVQGSHGSYFTDLLGLVHRYARGSRLMMVAGLGNVDPSPDNGGNWLLTAVRVVNGKPAIPTTLNGVVVGKHETPKGTQRLLGEDGVINSVAPPSISQETPMHLYDPNRFDVSNTDCSSCHQAYLRDQASGAPTGVDQNSALAKKFNLKLNQSGLTGTPLQMFSFNPADGSPVISPRTAAESAAAADYINRVYLHSAN